MWTEKKQDKKMKETGGGGGGAVNGHLSTLSYSLTKGEKATGLAEVVSLLYVYVRHKNFFQYKTLSSQRAIQQ